MKKNRFFALLLLFALLLPVSAQALDDPEAAATAALLVDATHDTVLYELNAHEKRYPASITKVMTALLTLEAVDRGELALTDLITADPGITTDLAADGSTQGIEPGETMTVENLLYCALLPSANEACNVLAYAVAGSIPEFVAQMNQRAAELGMKDTHFANAHGLHNDDHYTSAWDIYLMAREAMKNETFREIVSTTEHTVPATNLNEERHFYNTNALLSSLKYGGYVYQPAIGIKTGSTNEAGYCLASAAEQDGRTLYCVVLGCEMVKQQDNSYKRMYFSESSRLLQWGYNNFSERVILDSAEPVDQVDVSLSKTEYVLVRPEGSLSALLPNDLDVSEFTQTVTLNDEVVEAPISEGQVLGSLTLSYNGKEYGSLDLVALNDVERSNLLYYIDRTEKFFSNTWVKIGLVVLAVLMVALLVLRSNRRRDQRRRTRSYVGSGGRRQR